MIGHVQKREVSTSIGSKESLTTFKVADMMDKRVRKIQRRHKKAPAFRLRLRSLEMAECDALKLQ